MIVKRPIATDFDQTQAERLLRGYCIVLITFVKIWRTAYSDVNLIII